MRARVVTLEGMAEDNLEPEQTIDPEEVFNPRTICK